MTPERHISLPFRLERFGGWPGSACELPRPKLYVSGNDHDHDHDCDHVDDDDDDDDDGLETGLHETLA